MDKNRFKEFLENELHLTADDALLDSFQKYEDLLLEWNDKFNLTAIKDPQEILEKHFIDSAYLLKFVSLKKHDSLLDIGSGAGFPALVLAILNKEVNFTLVESNGKKVSFLNEVVQKRKRKRW